MTLDNFIQKTLNDICEAVKEVNTKSKFCKDEYFETDVEFELACNGKGEPCHEYEAPVNRIKFTVHLFKKV